MERGPAPGRAFVPCHAAVQHNLSGRDWGGSTVRIQPVFETVFLSSIALLAVAQVATRRALDRSPVLSRMLHRAPAE